MGRGVWMEVLPDQAFMLAVLNLQALQPENLLPASHY